MKDITRSEVEDAAKRLGLSVDIDTVTDEEVTAAYRAEMRRSHPDVTDLPYDDVAMLIRSAQAARSLLLVWIHDRPKPCDLCNGTKRVGAGFAGAPCPKCGE